MTALRATWLTWRLHRFEMLAAATLMAVVALSAWVVAQHVDGLAIPRGCWDGSVEAGASELCQRLVRSFDLILGNEGGHVRMALFVVPTLVGLVVGSVLVGRELETRTAPLAWSLEGGRLRWLAQRLGGALVLVVIGLTAMAWTGGVFEASARIPGHSDQLGALAMRGLPLVSRGLAALGIALLAGAILGRTLPALLVATVAVGALWYVGSAVVPQQVAPSFATWVDDRERRDGDFVGVVDFGLFDTNQPGPVGTPGLPMDWNEANQRGLRITCGPEPGVDVDDPVYEACLAIYDPSMTFGWWRAVPASALPIIEGAEVTLDLLVAFGSVALTAGVVVRRHPD